MLFIERVARLRGNGGVQENHISKQLSQHATKDIIKSRIKEHCYFGENFPKLGAKISFFLETSQKQSYLGKGDIEVEEGSMTKRRFCLFTFSRSQRVSFSIGKGNVLILPLGRCC